MFEPVITAFRILTILPVPGRESKNPASALPFFPVVGTAIGLLLCAVAWGAGQLFPLNPLLGALVCVSVAIVLTGALHLDGFADIADAFGGGTTRERMLAILKDSRHGTFGVTTIVLDVAAKIILYAWCIDYHHFELLALSVAFSRTAQAWGCSLFPYAIPEGGGTSVFFTGAKRIQLVVVSVVLMAVAYLFAGETAALVIIGGAVLPVVLFCRFSVRILGGLTGDCLGAANEMGELSVLLTGVLYYTIIAAI